MIVDDSRIFRSIIEACITDIPDLSVEASLWSGEKLLEFLREHPVDLVTLDVEMPGIDGLETLRKIQELNKAQGTAIDVIMVSGLTQHGAAITMEALELGAFDFISKPPPDDPRAKENLKKQLHEKIKCWRTSKGGVKAKVPSLKSNRTITPKAEKRAQSGTVKKGSFDVICIGVSTGGPKALHQLLPRLCELTQCPILIVQHMPAGFTASLAEGLNKKCSSYQVKEGCDDDVLLNKNIYIAPGGEHMVVRKNAQKVTIGIHSQPPENGCRPAVDVLFRSVAQAFEGKKILAVVLTGMGSDGTAGLRPLKRAGAVIVAQDEASSIVWGMPGSAVSTGVVDSVVALGDIPDVVHALENKGAV